MCVIVGQNTIINKAMAERMHKRNEREDRKTGGKMDEWKYEREDESHTPATRTFACGNELRCAVMVAPEVLVDNARIDSSNTLNSCLKKE